MLFVDGANVGEVVDGAADVGAGVGTGDRVGVDVDADAVGVDVGTGVGVNVGADVGSGVDVDVGVDVGVGGMSNVPTHVYRKNVGKNDDDEYMSSSVIHVDASSS